MKSMNTIVAISLLFIAYQSIVTASSSVPSGTAQQKAQALKSRAASVKAQAQAKKARQSPSQASAKASSSASTKESSEVKQLVEELKSAVEEIKCSCGSSKSDKDGKSESGEKRCTHDKEHIEKVEKAFQVYKKLHKALEKGCMEKEDHDKVKPHVKKLFECKNIQKMAFGPRSCRAESQKQ